MNNVHLKLSNDDLDAICAYLRLSLERICQNPQAAMTGMVLLEGSTTLNDGKDLPFGIALFYGDSPTRLAKVLLAKHDLVETIQSPNKVVH